MREGLRLVPGAWLLAACLAAGLAGCSTLPSLEEDGLVTGSIRPTPASLKLPEGAAPKGVAAGDWVQAKAALDQALAARDKDVSIPWENRDTGAHGTATPIGAQRTGGCRDFMISLVDGKTTDRWIQGEACKATSGLVLQQVRILGRA
ncbi:RT0821/Lpp0805 family surface protein [Xanthobacter autotrophicus DSM 431]|uniref:RT0821/Lpp0805 family surface protein n=1 Tax=Xanthobacter nonsaccharivorans TaxID=3119912 RepID=UPI0037272689